MKKWILILIIICSSFSVFGEEGQNKEINELKQRVEQLEKENKEVTFYENRYEKQIDILKEDFENKKIGLETKFDKLSQDNFSIFLVISSKAAIFKFLNSFNELNFPFKFRSREAL